MPLDIQPNKLVLLCACRGLKYTAVSLPVTADCTCAIANGGNLFPFPDYMLLGQGGVRGQVCLICLHLSINPAHSKCLIHIWKGKKEDENFLD